MNAKKWWRRLSVFERRVRRFCLRELSRIKLLARLLLRDDLRAPPPPLPTDDATHIRQERDGFNIELLASGVVHTQQHYAGWLAPLRALPPEASFEQVKETVEKLLEHDGQEQLFFPLEAYLRAVAPNLARSTEWVQFCRALRKPSHELLASLAGQSVEERGEAEPTRFLFIHAEPPEN